MSFPDVLAALEVELISTLELSPRELPKELSRLEGRYKDAPMILEARAYQGPRIRYARFVTVIGADLQIANAMVLPANSAPIFGVDLIARASLGSALAVIDLSPVLKDRVAPKIVAPQLPSRGDLPAWASRWFSDDFTFAEIREAQLPMLRARLSAYARAFVESVERAERVEHSEPDPRVRERQDAYAAAHREEDRGLQLLAKIFEAEHARRFIDEVMFP